MEAGVARMHFVANPNVQELMILTVMIHVHVIELLVHTTVRSMTVALDVHSQKLFGAIATSANQHLVWVAMLAAHRILLVSATRHAPPVSVEYQAV
jgi:hypothetical protein